MTNFFNNLRKEIADLESQLALKKYELSCGVKACQHNWSKPIADHIYEEGYTIPGDPPGTMGVDWRGPVYVEPKTTHR